MILPEVDSGMLHQTGATKIKKCWTEETFSSVWGPVQNVLRHLKVHLVLHNILHSGTGVELCTPYCEIWVYDITSAGNTFYTPLRFLSWPNVNFLYLLIVDFTAALRK